MSVETALAEFAAPATGNRRPPRATPALPHPAPPRLRLTAAGLDRVNISIDTLDPDRFRRITRGGDLGKVFAGIHAAEEHGLTPVKLNAVVVRGFNDYEVAELAGLTLAHPWQMRFIEIMPLDGVFEVARERLVPSAESREAIQARWGPLTPEPHDNPAG